MPRTRATGHPIPQTATRGPTMTALTRRLTNSIARTLRAARRSLLPGLDTRQHALTRAYQRWVTSAARLDYVEDVVGHKMFLDEKDSLRLSVARVFEPVVTRLFEREVRDGQTVLDIGANIGYFTLLLARQVGPTGRVFAFEPDPTNFGLLQRNVAANGYSNVSFVQRAVWSATGPLRLYLSDENKGDHRVYDSDDGRAALTIEAVRLDDYFASLPDLRVDVVKMDVQGSEAHALSGMRGLLGRRREATLVTEFWPAGLHRAGSSARGYLEALSDLGFRPYLVDERADRLLPADPERLLAEYTIDNDGSADLACRRG